MASRERPALASLSLNVTDDVNDDDAADLAALPVVRGWARRFPGGLSELKVRAAFVIQRSMRGVRARMHMHHPSSLNLIISIVGARSIARY